MRTQMAKERHPAANMALRAADSNAAEVTPTSSAVIAVTMAADMQDTLAVVRTAALLARSLKATLSIDVLGLKSIIVACTDSAEQAPVKELLDPIHHHLRESISSGTRSFVSRSQHHRRLFPYGRWHFGAVANRRCG